ncbi:hypothetical protein [Nonomuraea longicatena]
MADQDLSDAFAEDVGAVLALAGACEGFATHVELLADRLAGADLSDDDVALVNRSLYRAVSATWLAGAMTVGLRMPVSAQECPHFNVVTDAEWIPLAIGAGCFQRDDPYACVLEPGHDGAHASILQEVQGTGRPVWLRWSGRDREVVSLPPCPYSFPGADPRGVDDEACKAPDGHPGEHRP